MAKFKRHLFSIGFFLITVGIACYAIYFDDDILPDGTVVETGRMLMPFMFLAFICFVISLIVEHFHNKKVNQKL